MTQEQPTPETDFEEAKQTQRFGGYMVKANFARKLERERDAALEEIANLKKALFDCREDSIELLAERAWYKDEPRARHQNIYRQIKSNIERADILLKNYEYPAAKQ